jgi:hypothetical protein
MNYLFKFSPNEWGNVNENDTSMIETNVKSPEEFQREVEELKAKYNLKNPNLWEKSVQNDEAAEHHSTHEQSGSHKH